MTCWVESSLLFATDSTPDEQPQQIPELHERRADGENRTEVNCNGHASTPESEASLESQGHGTKQLTEEQEEQEDQENANQPENTEAHDTLGNKQEHLTCNGSPGDPNTELQQLPASLNLNSVAVELKEGDHNQEKKEDGIDMQGETKREDEDKDSQNG